MKVAWATDYFGVGNSYGYSMHNAMSRAALERAGVILDRDAAIMLHVAPGHLFRPVEGRVNVLYTAWEMDVLPPRYVAAYDKADAVIVTARFLVDTVKRHLPEKPIFLCHEGVDVQAFPYQQRQKPKVMPFRFLWVGAPNARKGWELVLAAFAPFMGNEQFELYIKTTITEKVERVRNVIFDSRNFTTEQLCALYHSAHAFVFPSFGEGFGLTMAEAMATGLAPIFTPWSSLPDLADASCGYPLPYKLIDAYVRGSGGIETVEPSPDAVPCKLAQADTEALARTMIRVYENWKEAQVKGERAAKRICSFFTWDRTGRRLREICEEVSAMQLSTKEA